MTRTFLGAEENRLKPMKDTCTCWTADFPPPLTLSPSLTLLLFHPLAQESKLSFAIQDLRSVSLTLSDTERLLTLKRDESVLRSSDLAVDLATPRVATLAEEAYSCILPSFLLAPRGSLLLFFLYHVAYTCANAYPR